MDDRFPHVRWAQAWIKPLRSKDIVPDAKRDDFVTQVFWNVLEIHAVNSRLAELMSKRQKQQAVVDRIGDILLEIVPHFQPFVKYGAHQLYGKYEFEKEKASNTAFSKFVDVSNASSELPRCGMPFSRCGHFLFLEIGNGAFTRVAQIGAQRLLDQTNDASR